MEIRIDQEKCKACGICIDVCVYGVFKNIGERVEVVKPEDCWLCGHCVAACPSKLIQHSNFNANDFPVLNTSLLPSFEQLALAFRGRHSVRVFRDRPVPHQIVERLIDITRWVPSACNKQSVDWWVTDDRKIISRLSDETVKIFAKEGRLPQSSLVRSIFRMVFGKGKVDEWIEKSDHAKRNAEFQARGIDPIFYDAPILLLAHVPEDNNFGRDDSIYVAYNLMLSATRMGLGTCQIGNLTLALDHSIKLRNILGLPKGRRVEVALILGYPKYRIRHLIPRRKPEILWVYATHEKYPISVGLSQCMYPEDKIT
jgi:nitroreductase/NAD-dependent dihydropyrimidine dehydrogenase PreA subunit